MYRRLTLVPQGLALASVFPTRRCQSRLHSSSSRREHEAGASAAAEEAAEAERRRRRRMSTLGDFLEKLPWGPRQLLVCSPLLALLYFTNYKQRGYYLEDEDPWYYIILRYVPPFSWAFHRSQRLKQQQQQQSSSSSPSSPCVIKDTVWGKALSPVLDQQERVVGYRL